MENQKTLPTITPMGVYVTAPFTPYFEDEVSYSLDKDDATILEERYRYRTSSSNLPTSSSSPSPSSSKVARERQHRLTKSTKSQTQWTRALDAVQEHFSSHVSLDGSSHKLPPNIYALKTIAKHNWVLYKKRECERRKRIRRKIEKEKDNERNGKPANVLMAMVDSCEACKRLYVTVNLFWGVTLCDSCYFNPGVINEIMKSRNESAEQKMNYTPENIVKEVIRYRKEFFAANKRYYEIPTTTTVAKPSSSYSSNHHHHPITSSPINTHALEKNEVAEGIVLGDDDLLSLSPCSTSSDEEEEEKYMPPLSPPPSPLQTPSTPLLPPTPSYIPRAISATNDSQASSFINEVVDYFDDNDVNSSFYGGSTHFNSQRSLSSFSQQAINLLPLPDHFFSQSSNLFTENPLSFHYESTKHKSPMQ